MRGMELRVMDARTLDFPDESFDAVYLPLVLTVVEDGARVFAEAARVAAPGGRLVVADRFWPEGRSCPPVIRAASWVLGHFAMRFDRRVSEVRSGAPSLKMEDHRRVGPGAFFHLVTFRKPFGASWPSSSAVPGGAAALLPGASLIEPCSPPSLR